MTLLILLNIILNKVQGNAGSCRYFMEELKVGCFLFDNSSFMTAEIKPTMAAFPSVPRADIPVGSLEPLIP